MGHGVGVVESWQCDDGPEAQHRKDCADEPHDDGAARCLDSVDFGGDISHDIGEREEEEPAVSRDGAELHPLGPADVGQDDHDAHECEQYVVVPRPAIGISRADSGR